jgi:hypothetical protein
MPGFGQFGKAEGTGRLVRVAIGLTFQLSIRRHEQANSIFVLNMLNFVLNDIGKMAHQVGKTFCMSSKVRGFRSSAIAVWTRHLRETPDSSEFPSTFQRVNSHTGLSATNGVDAASWQDRVSRTPMRFLRGYGSLTLPFVQKDDSGLRRRKLVFPSSNWNVCCRQNIADCISYLLA